MLFSTPMVNFEPKKRKEKRSAVWFVAPLIVVLALIAGVVIIIIRPGQTNGGSNGPPTATPTPKVTHKPPQELAPTGMAYVPGGTFVLGRVNSKDDYEKPAHEVKLTEGYYMDKLEVTNEDYLRFVQQTNHNPPSHWGGRTPSASILLLPVTNVSWDDAAAYCQWKGSTNGNICRLPGEMEWEHAARGAKNLLYVWGNDWHEGMANANHKDTGKLSVVGSNPQDVSPYGLFDMDGNAREWTRDYLTIYPGSVAKMVEGAKIARGGAFSDPPEHATNTYRSFLDPNAQNYDRTGFRCLCELPEAAK